MGIAFIIGGFPFFLYIMFEGTKSREKDEMFLEFSKNLVENVRAGTPISKAIFNLKHKDYRALNPHIKKLSNQISLGIPVQKAFDTFAKDIGSEIITRAINIIGESEKAGGQIEDVLSSVVKSVSQIEKLRKERRSAMYTLVVQGYIIFFIFLVIILVMEFKILPISAGLSSTFSSAEAAGDITSQLGMFGGGKVATPEELAKPFLWFLIIQGFFTGLIIGKLSEGKVKYGLKHSFILMVIAILISTGSKLFIQTGTT
jgi:flagellar protein FlaJ